MKEIYSLFILDRSGSMQGNQKRTIEAINSNLQTQREESKKSGISIRNTLMTFASVGQTWNNERSEKDMIFVRVNESIDTVQDITEKEYQPNGGTPLLDAIGIGVERLRTELGDHLGSDDVNVIVTIFTDGEENSSTEYTRDSIKKMIEHFQSDGKWTFAFIGCGSFDNVSGTSKSLGIDASNTMAYADTSAGYEQAFNSTRTMYCNYVSAVSNGTDTKDLFNETPTK